MRELNWGILQRNGRVGTWEGGMELFFFFFFLGGVGEMERRSWGEMGWMVGPSILDYCLGFDGHGRGMLQFKGPD